MEKDRITWNEYFMTIAQVSALRSKDPNSKVGAVLVSEDNKRLSIGYNGAPRAFDDSKVPWNRDPELPYIDRKYPYMCHAEMNSVVNYGGAMKDFRGATAYVTLFPCDDCSKLLAQVGVKKVIYLHDYHHDEPIYEASRIILKECGIEYEQFKQESNVEINVSITIH